MKENLDLINFYLAQRNKHVEQIVQYNGRAVFAVIALIASVFVGKGIGHGVSDMIDEHPLAMVLLTSGISILLISAFLLSYHVLIS